MSGSVSSSINVCCQKENEKDNWNSSLHKQILHGKNRLLHSVQFQLTIPSEDQTTPAEDSRLKKKNAKCGIQSLLGR